MVVTVTDNNNCSTTANTTIVEPFALVASDTISSSISCKGRNDGEITLNVSGGTIPYSYTWTNSTSTSNVASGLVAQNYAATITDFNGCNTTINIALTEPDSISLTATIQHLQCFQDGSGSVTVAAAGGTSPYNYLWNNGLGTPNLINTFAGVKNVTVTDANNCNFVGTYTITEPSELSISYVADSTVFIDNVEQDSGKIALSVTGGTAPYTYLWSVGTFGNHATVSELSYGTYSVTITDANNCSKADTIFIGAIRRTGISQNAFEIGSIKLFPQPFDQVIQLHSDETIQSIRILSTVGAVIYESEPNQKRIHIDASAISAGIYIIEVNSISGQKVLFKSIKQ